MRFSFQQKEKNMCDETIRIMLEDFNILIIWSVLDSFQPKLDSLD